MKLPSVFLPLVGLVLVPAFVACAPASNSSYRLSVGTIYFTTNEPSGNAVVSADIDSDGKLVFADAAWTHGRGSHVNGPNTNISDPLYAQNPIETNVAAGLLATVNAGSNTVSVFKIDPNDPSKLTLLGNPTSTQGEFPISLAFNKAGNQLCVLNGGAVAGVSCFKASKSHGLSPEPHTLRPLAINGTTPPTGPTRAASQVIFTEDQKNLVAAIKGAPPTIPGYLAVYDVAPDGTVSADYTKVTTPSGGGLPFSITAIPGKQAIIASDATTGFDIFDFSKGVQKVEDSPRTRSFAVPGQGAICWSVYSPATKNFYLADVLDDIVTEVAVADDLSASIVKQYPTIHGSGTQDMTVASIKGKDYLYVLLPNATTVDVFSLEGPGQAQSIQQFNFAASAQARGVPINPFYLSGMAVYLKP